MKKTKTEITVMVTKFVVEASTTFVVSAILKRFCPVESKTQKIKLLIGASAISGLVADRVGAAVETQMVDGIQQIKDIVEKIKNPDFDQ